MVTNVTVAPGYEDVWVAEEIIGVVIVCLLVPFIIIGNIFVIFAVVKFRRLQVPTNYFLVSLAVADICTGILIPFITIAEVYKTRIEDVRLCLVTHCVIMTVGGASMFCLSAVAYDRYTAISRPLEYTLIVTERKIVLFTAVSWLYAALISWAPLFGWHAPLSPPERCSFHLIAPEALILLLAAMFLPPYLIIFYSYAKIFLVARHHAGAIAALENAIHTQIESHFLQRDTKYAKTLAIVIGFYILLWLPYQLSILAEVVAWFRVEDWVRNYLAFLVYLNSGLNPWIYAFRNKDFKYAFHQILVSLSHCACLRGERADSLVSAHLASSRARSLSTGAITTTNPPTNPPPLAAYITNSALDLACLASPGHGGAAGTGKRRGSCANPRGSVTGDAGGGGGGGGGGHSRQSSDGSVTLSNVLQHRDSLTIHREMYNPRRSIIAWAGDKEHSNIQEEEED